MLKFMTSVSVSALQKSALLATNIAVGGMVAGLTALTLMSHFEDTPEIRNLSCWIGLVREDCPQYRTDLDVARSTLREARMELAGLNREKDRIDAQLESLIDLDARFDDATFFVRHDDPHSGRTIFVGTKFDSITAPSAKPNFFCYVSLGTSDDGTSRSLTFGGRHGRKRVPDRVLTAHGLTRETLTFGQSVCEPLRIGPQS